MGGGAFQDAAGKQSEKVTLHRNKLFYLQKHFGGSRLVSGMFYEVIFHKKDGKLCEFVRKLLNDLLMADVSHW